MFANRRKNMWKQLCCLDENKLEGTWVSWVDATYALFKIKISKSIVVLQVLKISMDFYIIHGLILCLLPTNK